MSDTDPTLDAIARAAAELIPALTERLERHGLGEIEVSHGELRLRVAAGPGGGAEAPTASAQEPQRGSAPTAPGAGSSQAVAGTGAGDDAVEGDAAHASVPGDSGMGVTSPAVGFFVYADGLGPGLTVAKGDPLGHVEMLGVRHDVRAPRGGTVRHLVAESGEAVEYGQVVVELEGSEAAR